MHGARLFLNGSALLAACALVAGCGVFDGVRVEGAAPTAIAWHGTTYVTDFQSVPWDRPDNLGLTQHTYVSHLTWRQWGGNRAVGKGISFDMDCAPGCLEKDDSIPSYPVTLVLSGLTRRAHAAYYAHASLSPADGRPAPAWSEPDLDDLTLHVPEK